MDDDDGMFFAQLRKGSNEVMHKTGKQLQQFDQDLRRDRQMGWRRSGLFQFDVSIYQTRLERANLQTFDDGAEVLQSHPDARLV